MYRKLASLLAVVIISSTADVFLGFSDAEACVALGHPSAKIKLDKKKGAGVVVISEYNCFSMVPKTQCIAAVRLADIPGADKIKLQEMRFINTDDYSIVEGFDTKRNKATSKAFENFLGGQWYGFAGMYNAKINKRGGTAMEIKFTYDPTIKPKTIMDAFNRGHVGIGEGTNTGAIAPKGHHIEVIEIRGADIVSR